jgi:hypothetical protein
MVDISDLLRLIASWGQDDPAVDIGPRPFGDGIVDAADLEVLMSHWGQEVSDPTLVAYWKLDESEGTVAYDCACGNDGTVMGAALWQPDGGCVVGGTMENTRHLLTRGHGSKCNGCWTDGRPGHTLPRSRDCWTTLAPAGT